MTLSRRQLLASLGAGLVGSTARCRSGNQNGSVPPPSDSRPLRQADGNVDWQAVRDLFPLATDWIHLATFLLVSHPKPVAEAIVRFREKIDADPLWIEQAAFSDSEGRPFEAVKRSLAAYVGGAPQEICLTSNTTTALALAYHGLRIRADQRILTTEHDHYSQHESIRYAAARSGCGVDYVSLYDRPADVRAEDIVSRLAKAIGPKTRTVGVTWVHSSTGVKIPLAGIAEAVARANRGRAAADRCLLIVDGVHGFANQDVDVAELGCDLFAAGTHKWLFAPRGTGFLWGRSDVWPELRPTIPSFDPDAPQTWAAWMERGPLPPTEASFVSPGGFLAFEHLLAIPAAVALHGAIGRDRIAARVRELNGAFRDEASKIRGLTLHTPRDPDLSAGLSCFEVAGHSAKEVASRLEEKKIRTNSSPYRTSYARVAAGVMNSPSEIDAVLRELRALAGGTARRQ
jgi:selenocysteine lyase/cysteine desulfurase